MEYIVHYPIYENGQVFGDYKYFDYIEDAKNFVNDHGGAIMEGYKNV